MSCCPAACGNVTAAIEDPPGHYSVEVENELPPHDRHTFAQMTAAQFQIFKDAKDLGQAVCWECDTPNTKVKSVSLAP